LVAEEVPDAENFQKLSLFDFDSEEVDHALPELQRDADASCFFEEVVEQHTANWDLPQQPQAFSSY
jgi:hypothetical protein